MKILSTVVSFTLGLLLVGASADASTLPGVLEPGESVVAFDGRNEFYSPCGKNLNGVHMSLDYSGDYWGQLALIVNGREANEIHVQPNQNYGRLRTFGGFNELCRDIHRVEVMNTGRDPIYISGLRLIY